MDHSNDQPHSDQPHPTPKLSPLARKYVNYIELDSNERIVCEVGRHPIGLLVVWLVGLFIAVAVMAGVMGLLYLLTGDRLGIGSDLDVAKPLVAIAGFILVVLILIMTAITAWIYTHNMLLVTNEKIAEITYVSIFNRKITQLDLVDIQNVSVAQTGIFPRIFGYGTLFIETAGERENVTLTYVPFPYRCAKEIVGVREIRKGHAAGGGQPPVPPPVTPVPPVPPATPTPMPPAPPAPASPSTPSEQPPAGPPTH